MVKRDDAVVRAVTAAIAAAVAANRRQEMLVVAVLVTLFVVGLGLLVYAAIAQAWVLLAPGGLVQVTVVFPVLRLIRLREDDMRLLILPQLMRLADTAEAKLLAA